MMARFLFALCFTTALPSLYSVGGVQSCAATPTDDACEQVLQEEQLEECDGLSLMQASFLASPAASPSIAGGSSGKLWPTGTLQESLVEIVSVSTHTSWIHGRKLYVGCAIVCVTIFMVVAKVIAPQSNVIKAVVLAFLYIMVSVTMIESNKWLMSPGHFPFPLMLTTNHMITSIVLANSLWFVCPSAFPALQKIEVTRWFCVKFLPIGAAFAASIVCGNAAYKFCSVSLLQIMKQSNMVIIYSFSVIAGLEALRRCSVLLLAGVLCGALMAVQGELHFSLTGVSMQLISSLCEAAKVIIQGLLMSGTTKLDPLTMVLFMAPACLAANLIPFAFMELPRLPEILASALAIWPVILCNAMLAFGLNVIVAQCIKSFSPVGYLLCGVVKDVTIISTSSWIMGESLAPLQQVGFCLALAGVFLYSIYKQNLDSFSDDNLLCGFHRLLFQTGKDGKGGIPSEPEVQGKLEDKLPAGKHNPALAR